MPSIFIGFEPGAAAFVPEALGAAAVVEAAGAEGEGVTKVSVPPT